MYGTTAVANTYYTLILVDRAGKVTTTHGRLNATFVKMGDRWLDVDEHASVVPSSPYICSIAMLVEGLLPLGGAARQPPARVRVRAGPPEEGVCIAYASGQTLGGQMIQGGTRRGSGDHWCGRA